MAVEKMHQDKIEDIISLSPLQEGMLFHYLTDETGEAYFEQLCLYLQGELDMQSVRQAWEHVAKTNELFRALYRWEKLEKPVQVILKAQSVPVEEIDLSQITEASEKDRALERVKKAGRQKKFILAAGPLIRITVCKLAHERYVMIVNNHHIVFDGWSSGIILREFFTAYEAFRQGLRPVLQQKTRFKEYLKWLQRIDKASSAAYWQKYLEGFESKTILPSDHSGKRVQSKFKTYSWQLADSLKPGFTSFLKTKN